jgi:hypothetical protein
MENFSYKLEPYKGVSSRYTCPQCKKLKEYTRYINIQTGEYLSYEYGICNRKDKCGYHVAPSGDFSLVSKMETVETKPKEIKYIASSLLKQSVESSTPNYFKEFITRLHPDGKTVLEHYKVGTSKKWKGSSIFWQMDSDGRIARGKIMLYDDYCKRVKKCISSVHHELQIKELLPPEELFGLWRVFEPENKEKTIAIVESEKTAIISSLFLPEYLWLATGALDKLSFKRLESIKHKKIVLFPDLKKNETSFSWEKKGKELETLGFNISTNNFLERYASQKEKEEGLDIADYLLASYFRENIRLKQVFGKKIYEYYVPPFRLDHDRLLASQKEYFLHQADFFQNNLYQKPYYPIISKFYQFLAFQNNEETALKFLLNQRNTLKERNEILETWIYFLKMKHSLTEILKYLKMKI